MMRIALLSMLVGLVLAQQDSFEQLCSQNGGNGEEAYVVIVPGTGCRRYLNCQVGRLLRATGCPAATVYDQQNNECTFDQSVCGDRSLQTSQATDLCDQGRPNYDNNGQAYHVRYFQICNKFITCGAGGADTATVCGEGTVFRDGDANDPDNIGRCVDENEFDCSGMTVIAHADATG